MKNGLKQPTSLKKNKNKNVLDVTNSEDSLEVENAWFYFPRKFDVEDGKYPTKNTFIS